jgi:hypothetical protein
VIGNSGDLWNMATGPNGTVASLEDTGGNSTGVGLSWNAAGQWNEADPSVPYNDTAFNGTPYQNLMGSYLTFNPNSVGGSSNPGSIDITGLTAGADYGIYFYSQANENTQGRIDDFDANGVQVSTLQVYCPYSPSGPPPGCPGTFVYGQNYTFADNVVADANGDINVAITVPGDLTYEGDVNGFQLESLSSASTPEPATTGLMLLALGAGASLLRRRRQSRLSPGNSPRG